MELVLICVGGNIQKLLGKLYKTLHVMGTVWKIARQKMETSIAERERYMYSTRQKNVSKTVWFRFVKPYICCCFWQSCCSVLSPLSFVALRFI